MLCSNCQQPMSCSANGECWCMALPNILPLGHNQGCMCRTCLIKALREYIEQLASKPIEEQLALAKPYHHANQFTEGLDYDIEDGLMVMSRWAHLKRGSCCGNGCRHCPFKQRQSQ